MVLLDRDESNGEEGPVAVSDGDPNIAPKAAKIDPSCYCAKGSNNDGKEA